MYRPRLELLEISRNPGSITRSFSKTVLGISKTSEGSLENNLGILYRALMTRWESCSHLQTDRASSSQWALQNVREPGRRGGILRSGDQGNRSRQSWQVAALRIQRDSRLRDIHPEPRVPICSLDLAVHMYSTSKEAFLTYWV